MADPTTPFPYLDPAQAPAWMDVQRKQQLAQMLMQSFQQSNQTPENWNSMRQVPKRGALGTVASLATALMAGRAQNSALDSQQQYMTGLMGGGQPAPSTGPGAGIVDPSAPPAAQDAAQNVTAGNVQTAPGSAMPAQQNSMIPPGMPRGQANALVSMMGPEKYAEMFIAPNWKTPEIVANLRSAGIDPNGPQGQAIQQATVKKGAYIPPIEQREGSIERDPLTNAVIGENPKMPVGGVNFYDPRGNLTGSGLSPGSAGAISQSEAASTAGKVSQTPIKVGVDAGGQDVLKFPTPPALAGAQSQGGAGGSTGSTASAAVLEAQKKGGESGQNYSTELSKNSEGALELRRGISELRNLASQATPSSMNAGKEKVGAYFIAAGMDPKRASSILGVSVPALQAAEHTQGGLAVSAIHGMTSRGTNFDLETFMRQNPNLDMNSPEAFNRVADYMDAKAQQTIAKQKNFAQGLKTNQWGSPDQWEAHHTAAWNDLQNQAIEQGKFNSKAPGAPTVHAPADLQAEMKRRGLLR